MLSVTSDINGKEAEMERKALSITHLKIFFF